MEDRATVYATRYPASHTTSLSKLPDVPPDPYTGRLVHKWPFMDAAERTTEWRALTTDGRRYILSNMPRAHDYVGDTYTPAGLPADGTDDYVADRGMYTYVDTCTADGTDDYGMYTYAETCAALPWLNNVDLERLGNGRGATNRPNNRPERVFHPDGGFDDPEWGVGGEHAKMPSSQAQMSAHCRDLFNAGQLDLNGANRQDVLAAQALGQQFGMQGSAAEIGKKVLAKFTNLRYRSKKKKSHEISPRSASAASVAGPPPVSGPPPAVRTEPSLSSVVAEAQARKEVAQEEHEQKKPEYAQLVAVVETALSTLSKLRELHCEDESPGSTVLGIQQAVRELMGDVVQVSPAKANGTCDVMGHGDALTALVNEHPSAPYEDLYNERFTTKQQACDAVNRLGAQLEKNLCSRAEANKCVEGKTKKRGGKVAIFGCGCTGCTSSLAVDGMQPFQLFARATLQSVPHRLRRTFGALLSLLVSV